MVRREARERAWTIMWLVEGPAVPALGDQHVVQAVLKNQLRAFQAVAFNSPFGRNRPPAVDFPHLALDREPIACKLNNVTAGEVEPAPALRSCDVPGVDVANLQVDWVAPRAFDVRGDDHMVSSAGWVIDVKAPRMMHKLGCPDITVITPKGAYTSGRQLTRSRECQIKRPGA